MLLIPTVIGLVMLLRWFQRKPVFTDREWQFLLVGYGRSFSLRKN
jgi:hypothetical protein